MAGKLAARNPEEAFRKIYKKCLSAGLTSLQISELPSVRKLVSKSNQNLSKRNVFRPCLTVVVAILAMGLYFKFYTSEGFTQIWFYFAGLDLSSEMCTIRMPLDVQTMFMPPVDCSVCRNLTTVEKVFNITPSEFEKRFAYSAVPVIVSDGTRNWSALDVFNFEFFKKLYLEEDNENRNFEVKKECQFFPYQTEFISLAHTLSMSPERSLKPWYIGWSNCDSKIGNILRKHYRRPYFLPLQSESTNMDWIFMGTPGHGANMHVDHVENPSWQAQIKGRKLWTLEPAPECYKECKRLEVLVEPGEVIVLDTNQWYHQTSIIGSEQSITIGSEYD